MNIIGALDQPTDGQYLLDGECGLALPAKVQKQYSDQIDAIALSESVGRVND